MGVKTKMVYALHISLFECDLPTFLRLDVPESANFCLLGFRVDAYGHGLLDDKILVLSGLLALPPCSLPGRGRHENSYCWRRASASNHIYLHVQRDQSGINGDNRAACAYLAKQEVCASNHDLLEGANCQNYLRAPFGPAWHYFSYFDFLYDGGDC